MQSSCFLVTIPFLLGVMALLCYVTASRVQAVDPSRSWEGWVQSSGRWAGLGCTQEHSSMVLSSSCCTSVPNPVPCTWQVLLLQGSMLCCYCMAWHPIRRNGIQLSERQKRGKCVWGIAQQRCNSDDAEKPRGRLTMKCQRKQENPACSAAKRKLQLT